MTTTLIEVTCRGTLTPGASDDLDLMIRKFLTEECGKAVVTIQHSVLLEERETQTTTR